MFTVDKIAPDVARAIGICDEDAILNRVNAAVEILCAESDWDPTRGFVDLCVDKNYCFSLPDEVETILAVNIGGIPAQGHDVWFQFHLNGPGATCRETASFDWFDRGQYPTITDPAAGFQVVSILDSAADNDAAIRVYGYDINGRWVVSTEDGETVDGFLVPTLFGSQVVNPDAPFLSRITRVSKAITKGFIKLTTLDSILLGQYRPYETEPQYRRVRVSKHCTWVRVAYKKRYFELIHTSDLIPLHSPRAVVLMCQALDKFDKDRVEEGEKYYKMAVGLLTKKQRSLTPPTGPSIQIADRNLICDKSDRLDP